MASTNLGHFTVWNWLRYFTYAQEKALDDYSVEGESSYLARCERLLFTWELIRKCSRYSVWALQIDPLGNNWPEYRITGLVRRRIPLKNYSINIDGPVRRRVDLYHAWLSSDGILRQDSSFFTASSSYKTLSWAKSGLDFCKLLRFYRQFEARFLRMPSDRQFYKSSSEICEGTTVSGLGTFWSYWTTHRGRNEGVDMGWDTFQVVDTEINALLDKVGQGFRMLDLVDYSLRIDSVEASYSNRLDVCKSTLLTSCTKT